MRVLCLICVIAGAFLAVAAPSAFATGTISGTVKDGTTGLEDVCVKAWTIGPSGVRHLVDDDTTSATGGYSITIADGSYKLSFEDCGTTTGDYVTEWWDNRPSYNTAGPIAL